MPQRCRCGTVPERLSSGFGCRDPAGFIEAFVACTGDIRWMAVGLGAADQPRIPKIARIACWHSRCGAVGRVHLALKPDGGEIFVSNFGGDTISRDRRRAPTKWAALVGWAPNPWAGSWSAENSNAVVRQLWSEHRWPVFDRRRAR